MFHGNDWPVLEYDDHPVAKLKGDSHPRESSLLLLRMFKYPICQKCCKKRIYSCMG